MRSQEQRNKITARLVCAILASFFVAYLVSNTALGTVSGKVISKSTGKAIPNATVLVGDSRTFTSAEGRYVLRGVPSGSIKVLASAIGVRNSKAKEVHVLKNCTSVVDFVVDDSSPSNHRFVFNVNRACAPPKIDGRLRGNEWRRATTIKRLYLDRSAGRTASPKTVARLLYDDNSLYVAFDCSEPEMAALVARCPRRDHIIQDTIIKDDTVEVDIDPLNRQNGVDGMNYTYSFIVNSHEKPATTLCDLRQNTLITDDFSYDANGVEVASHRDAKRRHWYAEIKIPFTSIPGLGEHPKAGTAIGILLHRHRAVTHHGDSESSSALLQRTQNESNQWNDMVFSAGARANKLPRISAL